MIPGVSRSGAKGARATAMSARKKKEMKFEEALERLEQIVGKLEDGEISLDESLRLFQEGRKLGKDCAAQLAEVEKKARLLIEKEDGTVSEQPLDIEGQEREKEDEEEEEE